jgi:chemotaxis methyl-accepting protein methylase
MSQVVLPSARFRHVIFPTDLDRRKKVINFAAPGEPAADAAPAPRLSEEQAAFVDWLFRQAGLDAGAYRPETLRRRLPSCLRGLRARSLAEARRALEHHPALLTEAVGTLLIGVTAFFRDPAVFDALAADVLPGLLRARSGLHVWSAGCSDGAELYSVGMLIAEQGALAGSHLLGTDCRPEAIHRARAGLFDAASCKGVPPRLLARHFTAEGPDWRVAAPLRAALRWRAADVVQAQEPGVWDVILCRNTTMYLRAEAAGLLWQKFEALLRPGGVLVLGKAERPVGARRLAPAGPCLYRRVRG